MRQRELSYVSEQDPAWRRTLLRAIEDVSGRRRLLKIYPWWRSTPSASGCLSWEELLNQIDTRLDGEAHAAFPRALAKPLIMIAKHPFGIPDGVALMALAERIERPHTYWCTVTCRAFRKSPPSVRLSTSWARAMQRRSTCGRKRVSQQGWHAHHVSR